MFYNCTKFQNNPRGSVEKHPKICWIDMEWPYDRAIRILMLSLTMEEEEELSNSIYVDWV